MKTIITLAALAVFSISAFAQNMFYAGPGEEPGVQHEVFPSLGKAIDGQFARGKNSIDTLNQYYLRTDSFRIYVYPFQSVFLPLTGSNNRYNFVGNTFSFQGHANFKGVLVAYARLKIQGDADQQRILVYHNNNTTGLPAGNPIAGQVFSTNVIDTNNMFTHIPFSNPQLVTNNFTAMAEISNSGNGGDPSDTIVIYTNTHGNGNQERRAIAFKPPVNNSFPVVRISDENGGLDIDVMIIPIIENVPSNVSPLKINSLSVTGLSPVPATDYTNLSFTLSTDENVVIHVIDMNGRLITTVQDSRMPSGDHTVRIETAGIPAGNYFYTIIAGSAKMAGKLMVN